MVNDITAGSARMIAAVESQGERLSVPFGDGATVWRRFGAGPPLVLVHGGSGSWLHWLRNVEALSRRYTLYLPDLPGHGDSDMPKGQEALLLPDEPDDVRRQDFVGERPLPIRVVARIVAQAIATLIPEGQVRLAGFSFGGAVSCHVAERLAPRVAGVLLIGAVGLTERPFGRPREVRRWRDIAERDAFRRTHRHNIETLLFGDPAKVDELTIDVQIECTRRVRTRRTSRKPHSLPALRASGAPFGGLWGEHDATARDGVEAIRDALHSVDPAAPFEIVPGAGHWVAWEAAAEVNRLVPDIFDRMARGKT